MVNTTFAWFTSKDEVTNRLTANADYGVSIVESFVPPQNMIPGQQVNKDVYAVNTGTIGAYVKETVSGVLNYTYEKRVAEAPNGTADHDKDYVELSDGRARAIDGATTNEAGGYLAYFKAADENEQGNVELGVVNSATLTDVAESTGETPVDNPGKVDGTRWHPTTTGTYIFKRSIIPAQDAVAPADDYDPDFETHNPTATEEEKEANAAKAGKPAVPEKYTYAGYYYVATGVDDDSNTPDVDESEGKYYKIVIGKDPFRAASESYNATTGVVDWEFDISVKSDNLGDGITVNENGEIVGEPLIQYVKDVEVKDATPHLTYHNTGSYASPTTAYLEAWYTDGSTDASADYTNKQNALTAAEQAETAALTAYLNAKGDAATKQIAYENAVGAYNTARSRYDQTKADFDYANKLTTETTKLFAAAEDRLKAEQRKDNARNAMDDALTAVKNEATSLDTDARSDADKTAGKAGTSTTQFGDLTDVAGLRADATDISYNSIFNTDLGSGKTLSQIIDAAANDEIGSANSALVTDVQGYRTEMQSRWTDITNAATRLDTALANFDSLNSNGAWNDAERAAEYLAELYAARDQLETYLNRYETLYRAIVQVAETETTLTELGTGSTAIGAAIDAWQGRLTAMKTQIAKNKTANPPAATDGIDAKVQDYIRKYNDFDNEQNVLIPQEDEKWAAAVETYNINVGKAKTDYTTAIQTDQRTYDPKNNQLEKNDFDGLTDGTSGQKWLTNNNDTLVGLYSANRTDDGVPTVTDTNGDLWKTIGKDVATTGQESTAAKYMRKGDAIPESDPPAVYDANDYVAPVNNKAKDTAATFEQLKGSPDEGTKQKLSALENAMNAAKGNVTTPKSEYEAAHDAVQTKKDAYDQAVLDTGAARTTATSAAKSDDSSISIIIYLDDEETDGSPLNWTPGIADGETADEVPFYYNYILEPGETSDKLIDAVELNRNMGSKDYKSLVFDLNVVLDSAQITYAADQKTITSDAVTEEGFGNTATVGTPVGDDTRVPVQWASASATPATEKTYKVGLTVVDKPEALSPVIASTNFEGKTFAYKLTYGGNTYLGEKNIDGTTFYKANDNDTPTDAVTPAETIVLSVK